MDVASQLNILLADAQAKVDLLTKQLADAKAVLVKVQQAQAIVVKSPQDAQSLADILTDAR